MLFFSAFYSFDADQIMIDINDPSFDVNIFPSQSAELPYTHSRSYHHKEYAVITSPYGVSVNEIKERPLFFFGKGAHLTGFNACRTLELAICSFRGVIQDQTVPQSKLERRVHLDVNVLDTLCRQPVFYKMTVECQDVRVTDRLDLPLSEIISDVVIIRLPVSSICGRFQSNLERKRPVIHMVNRHTIAVIPYALPVSDMILAFFFAKFCKVMRI